MDNTKKYRFYLKKAMELIEELREHVTCSLPCVYCAKYDSNTVCDGKFEWLYEEAITELLTKDVPLSALSDEDIEQLKAQLRQLDEIIGKE